MNRHVRRLYVWARSTPIRALWRALPAGPRKRLGDRVLGLVGFDHATNPAIPRIYPTLQCNLACPYCSDGIYYDKSRMGYELLSADRWVEIIDSLPGDSVIFTGGEPTLNPHLPEIVNRIRQSHVMIYTNLTYDVEKFFGKLRKPVTVYASFHPNNKRCTPEFIIANARKLLSDPMCRLFRTIHCIRTPSNGDVDAYRRIFAKHGLDLLIDDDQFLENANSPSACNGKEIRTVHCTLDRILIGPDGQRRICVSKLVRNVADGLVPLHRVEAPQMLCHEYGRCSPCDEVAEIREIDEIEADPRRLREISVRLDD